MKQNSLYGMGLLGLGVLLAYLYRLQLPFALILILTELFIFPKWLRGKQRQKTEEKRFSDVNIYLEQMLYSFRKSGKILSALLDVEKLFPTGSMGETIHEAAGYIQETYDGEKITEKALTIIETEYHTRRMVSAHRLMLKAEQIGGSCEASIRILLKDRDMWEKETLSYRRHCQMQKRNITAAIMLSASLCLMTPLLCQTSLQQISVTEQLIYQITTMLMLLAVMGIYLYTETYFTRDWLSDDEKGQEISAVKTYQKVVNYDFKKARRKSFLWAAPVLAASGICMILDMWGMALILIPIGIFLLFQHRIDYALAKRSVIREIRKVFPDWLMEVSLLLQTENVANSIQKSIPYAPLILKSELELLVERIAVTPESNLPYSEFLQEFSIPETASAMGMLYSLSDGGGSDAGVQIEEILTRNAQWKKDAEEMANKDKLGKMYLLFLFPALLGALKMVVDMTLILFAFFGGIHG